MVMYCNKLSDKMCISFINVDVVYYYLSNFACIHKTIIKCNCILSCVFHDRIKKEFYTLLTTVPFGKRSRIPIGKPRVAGSIPGGNIYFHFELFACFPFLTAQRCP